jgi:hypothetical protein
MAGGTFRAADRLPGSSRGASGAGVTKEFTGFAKPLNSDRDRLAIFRRCGRYPTHDLLLEQRD